MYLRIFSKKHCSVAVLALAVFVPFSAHAAVIINEVMYDVPGADAGHEWVEVENTGPDSVDLSLKDFRFFDNGGKHLLMQVAGTSMLAPGALAILADKPTVFLNDHPSWQGTLFDSALNLTASETIGLMRGTEILDSVSYRSALGAYGDGDSLHRVGDTFVVGGVNPGAPGVPPTQVKLLSPLVRSNGGETGTAKVSPTGTINPSSTNLHPYAAGISALTPAEKTAGVRAVSMSSGAWTHLPATPWFFAFLVLLVFSATSLILIRKHG